MSVGYFIKSWEVHCAGCEEPLLGIGRNGSTPEAAAQARREGWRVRDKLWHCGWCAASKDAAKKTATQHKDRSNGAR